LFELLQNADDNVYASPVPTLSFSYGPGCLRIDCNEVGFDAGNVAAICGIRQSTKSGKRGDRRLAGERGMGFKSVFQAAEVVWIASNGFTFKFDQTKPLGIITPLWEQFPEHMDNSGSSIFLQLSPSYDEHVLVKELQTFDMHVLIFLKHVEAINIEVDYIDSSLWTKRIRKTQYEQDSNHIVVLQDGIDSLKYLTWTHVAVDLPQEVRRKDCIETDLMLAFPFPSEGERSILEPHNVYAFQPIRDYGFSFLIQADFILTASRDEIESTLLWNVRIRDAISEAFVSAMLHFNKGVLKYVWPCYLASFPTVNTEFFAPVVGAVLSQLEDSPVFESCAGNMVQPSYLRHVPADFCLDGEPFTLCRSTENRYLSLQYPGWVLEAMSSIGVSRLTPHEFLEDLTTMIATDAESIYNKPHKWHAQLTTTLARLSTDTELMPLVQGLAIATLDNDT
jgi:hypothetical protein